MTHAKHVPWKPGEPLPPPGSIVGDISLHAPGIKFGVVVAPESSDRVRRVTSKDPAVRQSAVAEIVEATWPASITEHKAKETEEYQLKRWGEYLVHDPDHHDRRITLRQLYDRRGYIGLAILDVEEDVDEREHRSQYVEADLDDMLDLIDQLRGETDGIDPR